MDEGADAAPGKPRHAFDRFFIVVDAIVPSRLRRVEAGQEERRREADDGLRRTIGHGNRYLWMASFVPPCRTLDNSPSPLHPRSTSESTPGFKQGGAPQRRGGCVRYRK